MEKQSEYSERLKAFNKARTDFDDSVRIVADKLGYSRRRIYMVLKYPNENPELFQRLVDYVNSNDYEERFNVDRKSKLKQETA